MEITGKSFLAIFRNKEETNSNEDVDEADGAADCEACIQTKTAIEGDEYTAETFLSIRKSTLFCFSPKNSLRQGFTCKHKMYEILIGNHIREYNKPLTHQ